jgi:L-asparagine transporter-like permease
LAAWVVTFLIALLGSGLELSQGGVCPTTSFLLPLCYVSLAMCLVIMGIYLVARSRKGNKLPLIQL